LALGVLRRNAACLASLRRFEAAAEAADERGRRRLWVGYRRGGAASGGRGRHHVVGGYQEESGGDGAGQAGQVALGVAAGLPARGAAAASRAVLL